MFLWTTTWKGQCYVKYINIADNERQQWLAQKRRLDIRCDKILAMKPSWSNNRFIIEITDWLAQSRDFAARFGNQNVPVDIRSAVHDVEEILHLPMTDFGPDTDAYYPNH